MANEGAIPCNAADLRLSLRTRFFGDEAYRRLPVIGFAIVLLVASPVVILIAPAVTALILAGWALAGLAVVLVQSWLGSATPADLALSREVGRLVEANVPRLHVSRAADLQRRAELLDLTHPYAGAQITRILQDLREATGEAWRNPCKKRRLPLPPV